MGTVSQACLNMKAFVIVALVAAVSGEASPTPRLLRCLTPTPTATPMPTTARGRLRLSPSPGLFGQIAAGAHVAEAIKDGRAHNVGVITNAAIAPIAATHLAYAGYPYAYYGKREAEADPALVYTSGLVGYPYAVGAHAVTYAGAPHAVAHTPFGTTHSSNVGICTNVSGAVVPCRRKREADA